MTKFKCLKESTLNSAHNCWFFLKSLHLKAIVSDDSVRMTGVKMNIECRKQVSSIPNIEELYGDGCPTRFQNESLFPSNDQTISPFESTNTQNGPTISPNELTTSPSDNLEFITSNEDSTRGEKNFKFKLFRCFLKSKFLLN